MNWAVLAELSLDCDRSGCVTIGYPAIRSWVSIIWTKVAKKIPIWLIV